MTPSFFMYFSMYSKIDIVWEQKGQDFKTGM